MRVSQDLLALSWAPIATLLGVLCLEKSAMSLFTSLSPGIPVSPANSKEQKRLKLEQTVLEHTRSIVRTGLSQRALMVKAQPSLWPGWERAQGRLKKSHYAPLGSAGCSSALTDPSLSTGPSLILSQRKATPAQLCQRAALPWPSPFFKLRARARRPDSMSGLCCTEHGLEWQEMSAAWKTSG